MLIGQPERVKKRNSSQSESDDDFNPISDEDEESDLDDEDNYYEDADFGKCCFFSCFFFFFLDFLYSFIVCTHLFDFQTHKGRLVTSELSPCLILAAYACSVGIM